MQLGCADEGAKGIEDSGAHRIRISFVEAQDQGAEPLFTVRSGGFDQTV